MTKYIYKLSLLLFVTVFFSACTEEEGTMPNSSNELQLTLYSYKVDGKYNPDNDTRIRVAASIGVKEAYYLAEKTEKVEEFIKNKGKKAYIDYVISKGAKISDFPNDRTNDIYVTGLIGSNTITFVAMGNGEKELFQKVFLGYEWVDLGKGKLISSFFGQEKEVFVQKLKAGLKKDGDLYQVLNPYKEGFSLRFTVKKDNTVVFEKQETGYVHQKYGMVSFGPQLSGKKEGNKVSLVGKFTVTAGAFGEYTEIIELPNK